MHIATTPTFRKACAITGALGWVASAAIASVSLAVGKHYPLTVALLFCLAVAITATVTGLVGGTLAPVEATYRHIYNAGWQDCHREIGGLVVVPESRLQDKREIKLDAS